MRVFEHQPLPQAPMGCYVPPKAVEVRHQRVMGETEAIFIASEAHAKLVEWPSASIRNSGIYEEPQRRLQAVLDAAAPVLFGTGGGFVVRAIDSAGPGFHSERFVLFAERSRTPCGDTCWLLRLGQ